MSLNKRVTHHYLQLGGVWLTSAQDFRKRVFSRPVYARHCANMGRADHNSLECMVRQRRQMAMKTVSMEFQKRIAGHCGKR